VVGEQEKKRMLHVLKQGRRIFRKLENVGEEMLNVREQEMKKMLCV
jgi:hypothetical protein